MSDSKLPNRRDFLFLAAGAFAVASVPLARARSSKLVRRTVPVMGATAEVAVLHHNRRYAYAAADAALAEIQRIEKLMTRFTTSSDIGRVNLARPGTAVSVSRETALVVAAGINWAVRTDGAFDPGAARITDLWDVANRHVPPPVPQIKRLANRSFYKHVDVDTRQGVIKLEGEDLAIDLGGIACGYAVDRAVAVLREWGINNGFINASGDIYALGHSENHEPWKVGVRSPSDASAIIATVEVSDQAIATSGDYEQYFEYQGRRYHHIMDPHTAAPRTSNDHTVTIQADDCATADAATTALFGIDKATAAVFLRRTPGGAEIVA